MKRDAAKAAAWRRRSKPLQHASVAPKPRKPINRQSAKRRAEQAERVRILGPASAVACVVQWDTGCRGRADDWDEILSRARGGSITDPANCRPVCRWCHDQLTTHPAEAERRGLTLHSWEAKGD